MGHSHHPLNPFGSVNIGGTLISQSANPVGYSDVSISVKHNAVKFVCLVGDKTRTILVKGRESVAQLHSVLCCSSEDKALMIKFAVEDFGLTDVNDPLLSIRKEYIGLSDKCFLSHYEFLALKNKMLRVGFVGSTNKNNRQYGYLKYSEPTAQEVLDRKIRATLSRLA